MTKVHQIHRRLDLSKTYPLSRLFILEKVFPSLLLLVLIAIAFLVINLNQLKVGRQSTIVYGIDGFLVFLAAFVGAVCLFQFVRAFLYRQYYRIAVINCDRLEISKGIILRKRASFPLAKISGLHLLKDWRGLVFGLATLEILTPGSRSQEFCHIEGLRESTAESLQQYVVSLTTEAVPSKNGSKRGREKILTPQMKKVEAFQVAALR